jgi:hypothetical protein
MISERQLIQTENEIETDAQSFASHIGLAKAIKRYDLRRVITFHSKVKSASEFQQDFSEVVDWMPEASRPDGQFITNYVSGEMSTSKRNQNLRRLGELEEGERAILSNARCLSEGVDVPALDGVAFIDPRNSEIDIVQAVGRAIRLSSSKTVGTIVIPVFIAEHEDPDEVLNSSVFKKVWAVVNALRSHDEGLGTELDVLRQQLGKRGRVGKADKIYFDLPTTISVDFEEALKVRVIESTSASWEFWFGICEKLYLETGSLLVRTDYKTNDGFALGSWMNTQRARKNQLSEEKTQRLNSIGFVWDPLNQQWERGFSLLSNFSEENGHCMVPRGYKTKDGYNLDEWVANIRAKPSKLTDERIKRLDDIGFVWEPHEFKWEQGFKALEEFYKQNGHCLAMRGYVNDQNFKLGNWVNDQRNNKELNPNKVKRLDRLGFA